MKTLQQTLKGLSHHDLKTIFFSGLSLFFILFTYPIVRAPAEAIFLDANGASKSPLVWFFSLIALAGSITVFNNVQNKLHIHKLFTRTFISFAFVMIICAFLYKFHHPLWSYPLFIGKEVYIVILVHMVMGYLNAFVKEDVAKIIYGPLGAMNSLGGILGGLLTAKLTSSLDPAYILIVGFGVLLFSTLAFNQTDKSVTIKNKSHDKNVKPVSSIEGVLPYVLMIALIILITQFCVSLMNFKFNIMIGELIDSKVEKTKFIAQVYTSVNSLSFIVQILLVPFLLRYFGVKKTHYFLPVIYLSTLGIAFIPMLSPLMIVSAGFVIFKGLDYSLFSTAKELLYFPLNTAQKYGAKYIIDMFVYRFGKGLISLLLIFVQNIMVLNILLLIFLCLWLISVVIMFKYSPNKSFKLENTRI